MEGWIKLHRKILDNPIVCKDGDYLAVWIYFLLNATHKEIPVLFKGKKIILKKGQLITGRKSISNQLKISESKIYRIINDFKSEQQIEQQTSNQSSLITILNWDIYQQSEQQNEQQMNNERTTDEQPVNTNKNVKNDKNKRNNIYGQKAGQNDLNLTDTEKQFNEFYNQYPRKMKKQDVRKWFEKNKPSNELFSSMMNSLEQFRGSADWQKDGGQFIPYPSTWLNQKRWEDEIQEKPKTGLELFYEEMLKKEESGENDI